MKTIKDLALAMLNATLLLAIVLVVSLCFLLYQLNSFTRGFETEIKSTLALPLSRLETISTTLEEMKANPDALEAPKLETLNDELSLLNTQLGEIRENITTRPIENIAQQIIQQFGDALSKKQMDR